VLVTVDEVLTRQAEPHHFWEVRTARIVTADGYRYLSGVEASFLQVLVVILLALRGRNSLLLIAGGARCIRTFFTDMLAQVPDKTMLLDWYRLHQKCADHSSRICGGKQARARLLLRLYRRLWRGDGVGTITMLQDYRPQARNPQVLDTVIAYLQAR
jgi:hypothetical protein